MKPLRANVDGVLQPCIHYKKPETSMTFLAFSSGTTHHRDSGAATGGSAGASSLDSSDRRARRSSAAFRNQGTKAMAAKAVKRITMYNVAGSLRHKNAIYEKELIALMKKRAIRQLVIICSDAGYSLAVLSDHRAETVIRPYEREGSKVIRLRPVNIETEGFAPLHSVRNKTVRQYRSLDTLVNSLKRCGPLPPIYLRQGASK